MTEAEEPRDLLEIEHLRPEHWPRVREIHSAGIATRDATFETVPPGWETWDADYLSDCRFVATADGDILGWAALAPVSDRCVYGGVAEVSVYVDPPAHGRGVGSALLGRLVAASEALGFWTLQAGVFPENEASVRLHRKLGFREVGVRERLGKMDEEWRDVLLLERRSRVTGTD